MRSRQDATLSSRGFPGGHNHPDRNRLREVRAAEACSRCSRNYSTDAILERDAPSSPTCSVRMSQSFIGLSNRWREALASEWDCCVPTPIRIGDAASRPSRTTGGTLRTLMDYGTVAKVNVYPLLVPTQERDRPAPKAFRSPPETRGLMVSKNMPVDEVGVVIPVAESHAG
jgi:hypothetical protein